VGVGRGRPRQSSAGTATPPSRQIWRSRSPNPVVTEGTSGLAAIDSEQRRNPEPSWGEEPFGREKRRKERTGTVAVGVLWD
jgi:hypothetical protein